MESINYCFWDQILITAYGKDVLNKESLGAVYTDVRNYTDFICYYTGICNDENTIKNNYRALLFINI